MEPSSHYESTEVTVNGFKYKKTNATVESLFTLNSSIDNSIAYTEPLIGDFSNVSMWGWKNTSDAYYIQKSLVWGYSYKNSSSAPQDNAYNRVNKIEINYGDFNFSGVPYIVFAESGGGNAENYTFGYSPEATGVNNNGTLNTHSLITDFEVNKFVWKIGSLQGITTTEAGLYLDNGTETAEHNIDVEQFLANPSNYLITKFSITNNASWDEDNSQWRNAVANFCPLLLFDSSETCGLYSLNQGPSGGATVAPSATGNLGFAGKYSVELWNNRQDNATAVPKMEHPNKTFHRAFQNSYTLGSNADNLVIEPKADTMELTNRCELGNTGDFYIGHDTLNNTSSYLQCYQHDYYKMIKDYTGAAKSHLTTYKKYITTFLKGELVSKLLASCGVFFTQLSYSDLNTAGCTPTHMDIEGLHLGEMDDSGFTTGNWINGEDIADYDGINKEGSIIHADFKPGPGPGPSGDDIDLQEISNGTALGGVTNLWLLTAAQMADFHNAINSADFDVLPSILSVMGLGIGAIKIIPDIEFVTNIVVKKPDGTTWSSGVNGHIVSSVKGAFSYPNIKIQRRYNDFRDFSPYATHELFIPMCGWVSIPDIAVDRSMTLTYVFDVECCKIRGVVDVDGTIVAEREGIMGCTVSLSTTGHGLYVNSAIVNGANLINSGLSALFGVGTGSELMALGGAANSANAIGNTIINDRINRTESVIGNGSRTGFSDGCWILVKSTYTNSDEPELYAHTVGYPCNKSGQLSSFSGYTVCQNPHININCTNVEKEEIKRLLEEGVIL